MSLDPLTQNIWFMPLMGVEWHLWKAGNPESVCGLPWSMVSQAWDANAEKPAGNHVCERCSRDNGSTNG